jgi:hypothetical protein
MSFELLLTMKYHSVCSLVLIGTPPPPPLPQASVSPPLGTKRGKTHSSAGERVGRGGGPNSDDWRKGLALCVYSVDLKFLQNEPTWQSAGCQLHTRESIERLSSYSERFINFLAEELAAFRCEGEHPLLSHSSHRTWTIAPLGQVTPAALPLQVRCNTYSCMSHAERIDPCRHTSSLFSSGQL